ncbi:hypothetical protein LSTR_LSTR013735 [Laodelphax striatellus]|uniref:Uncharacterized protein n=1 Tax=Laodelphax striatellus TaxID=195883 RepID=A0A482WM49_LAOST|nr:hypothetical protein LSTR_LSTR013735 [Laodelphax striatellus]
MLIPSFTSPTVSLVNFSSPVSSPSIDFSVPSSSFTTLKSTSSLMSPLSVDSTSFSMPSSSSFSGSSITTSAAFPSPFPSSLSNLTSFSGSFPDFSTSSPVFSAGISTSAVEGVDTVEESVTIAPLSSSILSFLAASFLLPFALPTLDTAFFGDVSVLGVVLLGEDASGLFGGRFSGLETSFLGGLVAGAGLGAAVVVFFNSTTLRLFSSLALFAGVAVGEALVRLVALPAVDTFCAGLVSIDFFGVVGEDFTESVFFSTLCCFDGFLSGFVLSALCLESILLFTFFTSGFAPLIFPSPLLLPSTFTGFSTAGLAGALATLASVSVISVSLSFSFSSFLSITSFSSSGSVFSFAGRSTVACLSIFFADF